MLVDPSGGKCGEVATATAGEVECYEFEGWYDSEDNLLDDGWTYTFTIEEDLDLVAWYTMIQYKLSLSASPTNGGTVTGAGTYDCCDDVSITAEATSDCWEFLGWYLVSDQHGEPWETEAATDFDLCKHLELVAWFELKTVTVTYKVDPRGSGPASELTAGGGTITRSNDTVVDYDCGHELTLRPRTNEGDTSFIRWEVETETGTDTYTTPQITIELTEDATITLFREPPENGN